MSQLLVPDMLSFDTDTGHRRRCGMVGKHRDTEDKVRLLPLKICAPV